MSCIYITFVLHIFLLLSQSPSSTSVDPDARQMEEEQREREMMPRSKFGPVGLQPLPTVLGRRERSGGHTHPRTNTLQMELAIEENLVYRKHTQLSCQIPGAPKSTFLMVFSPDGWVCMCVWYCLSVYLQVPLQSTFLMVIVVWVYKYCTVSWLFTYACVCVQITRGFNPWWPQYLRDGGEDRGMHLYPWGPPTYPMVCCFPSCP